jgi:hypothetical protein
MNPGAIQHRDHRVSLVQRSLRCEKYDPKKMIEAQEEPELRHELENLKQIFSAIEDVRGRDNHSRNKLHNCARTWPSGKRKP